MTFYEHTSRSLVKTITYRVAIIISTLIILFGFTQDVSRTVEITGVTTISSTIIYFLHERIWNVIHWGKIKQKS